jgi:hypothetical protein
MQFKIPYRIRNWKDDNATIFNLIIEYIEKRLQDEPRTVTYATNMNTDVAGITKEIVFCSTDNKFYGCTSGGPAGSCTWVAFN